MPTKHLLLLIAVLLLSVSCAETLPPVAKQPAASAEAARINDVFAFIDLQNRTVKKSPEWLKQAYGSYGIRKLNDVPRSAYGSYRQFVLDGKEVFIVVHPAFYVFFQNTAILSSPADSQTPPDKNIVQRFANRAGSESPVTRVIVEQERLMREFLEYMSVQKKLVILILPRDAKNHALYGVVPELDEYARYINECTNASESIVYVESDAFDNGFLRKDEEEVVEKFLTELGVTQISLGGGYIGRCVDNCYSSLRSKYSREQISFVPEILVLSPFDNVHGTGLTGSLLTPKGKVKFGEVLKYLNDYGISVYSDDRKNVTIEQPRIKRLSLYKPYR